MRAGPRARRPRDRRAPACRTSRTARSGCRARRRPPPCSGTAGIDRLQARKRRRERRVRMDDRADLAARIGRCRGGTAIPTTAAGWPLRLAFHRHRDDVVGRHLPVRQAGRRDEEAVEIRSDEARAHVARLAAVDSQRVHRAGRRDHRFAQSELASSSRVPETSRASALSVRGGDAALGDESRDEPRRRDVERSS